MIAKLRDMVKSRDGQWIISITTPENFSEAFDELKDQELNVEIKKAYKKRSLDANAYAWVLINKIAEKLQEKEPDGGWTPLEVYRAAIRDVAGACEIHPIPIDIADDFAEQWTSLGDGYQIEFFPSSEEGWLFGKLWKGSHTYSSQQMNILIKILIQEAEQQGIPTITDKEAEKLIGRWAVKKKENENVSEE